MPWLGILLLIAGVYVLVLIVRAAIDFARWLGDEREWAKEQKRMKQKRSKQGGAPPENRLTESCGGLQKLEGSGTKVDEKR
jgi:hypothetical protein